MSEPKHYRKLPVVVEAVRYDGTPESGRKIIDWATSVGGDPMLYNKWDKLFRIMTLEGVLTASPGDYVIRGVKGEFYPCKPGIFEETYEEVME